jgi:hypothetical protein
MPNRAHKELQNKSYFVYQDYCRGHYIISEGHKIKNVFLIIKGDAKITCTKGSPYYKYLCQKYEMNKKANESSVGGVYELGSLSHHEWLGIDFTLEENESYFFTAVAETDVTLYKTTVSQLLRMPIDLLKMLRTFFILRCGQHKEKIFRNQNFLNKMPNSEVNMSKKKSSASSLLKTKYPFATKNMLFNIKKKSVYKKTSSVQNSPKNASLLPSMWSPNDRSIAEMEEKPVENAISPQQSKYISYLLHSIHSSQSSSTHKINSRLQRPRHHRLQSISKKSAMALLDMDIEKMKQKFRHFSICHRKISLTNKEERPRTPNLVE